MISGGAPLIQIAVALEDRSDDIWFLIDTGADATVLHPADAQSLLGDGLHRIDFERDPYRAQAWASASALIGWFTMRR